MQDKFVRESKLESLINKLGYDCGDLLISSKYTLLENNLPDICADRIDYALRDGLHLQIISRQQADKIIEGLSVKDGEFIFIDEESAFLYSFNFYLLNLMFYGSPSEAHFNNDFGDLVKYAMKIGVLKDTDWFTNDVYLIGRLKKSSNTRIKRWLNSYNQKLVVYEDNKTPTKVFPKKIRVVDPKVQIKNEIKRLSQINPVYQKIVNDYKETHKEHSLPVKVFYKS